MHHRLSGRRTAAVLTAAATAVALSAAVSPASAAGSGGPGDHGHRHVLPDSQPHWLHRATPVGALADATQLHFGVLLKMRDAAGADALVQRLSDPGSPDYGHWLTGRQFRSRFAPTGQDVSAVQVWLRSHGFAVDKTLRSGMLVEAHGSTAAVEKAFATKMRNYRFHGRTLHTNTTPLSLPASSSEAVTGVIAGVVGLDQASTLKEPASSRLPGPPPGARYGVHTQPCSRYFGQKVATDKPKAQGRFRPYAVCGYTPQQLQKAYGVRPMLRKGFNGRGITVAITDAFASPTIRQDAAKYNRVHRQPQLRHFTQITPPPNGYQHVKLCGGSGWYGEETLDVQAVHAMAPGARIVYVGASDCLTGLDDAWAATIDNHVADVITNSWTAGVDDVAELTQASIDFYQQFSTEAALTGITVSFSSGDDGDHTGGGTDLSARTAEFPADLPYVTAAGGTTLEIGRYGQWKGEYGWQDAYAPLNGNNWGALSYSSGGGGGASMLFAQPFYQRGSVPASMSKGPDGPMRVVPDISMDASPNTGMMVGQTQVFPDGTYWDQYRIGGTSLSSPLLAGMAAVAGDRAGQPVGFANPLYYRMASTGGIHDLIAPARPAYQVRTDFTNFLDGSDGLTFRLERIDTQSSTLHDVSGYDDETGVGSPDGPAFFRAVARQLGGGR